MPALAGAVLALAASGAARAAEIEYAVIYRALEAGRDIARYPRLRAVQRVESKREGVPPRAIDIAIHARAGRIDVPVGSDGTLALPIDDALLRENPMVETNQPAGSLTLTLSIELPQPAGPVLSVAEIEAALAEADGLLRRQRSRSHVRGVEFRFTPGDRGALTLRGEGERMLVPDQDGRVIVMRDADLAPHYAEIELATRPVRILPFLDR